MSLAERQISINSSKLSEQVAKSAYKLMAYKDEYEIGRLYSDGRFKRSIEENFEPGGKLTFHLAPPLLASKDPETGELRKREYGSYMMVIFTILAKLKILRGSIFDPFGYTTERKIERSLIIDFEQLVAIICKNLCAENYELAIEMVTIPMEIRGFGHVKENSINKLV